MQCTTCKFGQAVQSFNFKTLEVHETKQYTVVMHLASCFENGPISTPNSEAQPLWWVQGIWIVLNGQTKVGFGIGTGALHLATMHTVSFDWSLSGLEWIINLEFCLLKLLIFYQKLLWNIRSRLNSSTFWGFEPFFKYVWLTSSFFVHKTSILINHN